MLQKNKRASLLSCFVCSSAFDDKLIDRKYDQNNDGKLSRSELMHITRDGKKIFSEEDVAKDMSSIDFKSSFFISFKSAGPTEEYYVYKDSEE